MKMETRILDWLQINEFRILKHIVVIVDRNHNETELGSIFYKRELTENYKFANQQKDQEKENNANFLNGPAQKTFPSDDADHIILQAIKERYPKSYVRNDTILFNVDLEKLSVMKNRNSIAGQLYFTPEFSNADVYSHAGKSFPAPKIDFHFYSYYNPESIYPPHFFAHYPAENQDVLKLLDTIHFE
ncbi:hypothetical protein [Olivibacter sp. XZL3]|uniref:hypothetical protein n=1 Tax=Olivibacter sp. XZL3 TaxID=1735116 RepID=UPI001066BB35|nr:hypothetical protein [Olivibacter sp. XZL3]